jgi:hypothetical protein
VAAVDFRLALLPAESLAIHDGQTKDFDFRERRLHRLQFAWLDDSDD